MSNQDPTCIAHVKHVMGATVTARLDADLAGVAPLWKGRLQPIGQVGSLVIIPQGTVSLLASVVLVGLSELTDPLSIVEGVEAGDRWLRLQLLGEVDPLGKFNRGVSIYPGIDDAVHFMDPVILTKIYPEPGENNVLTGRLASNPDIEVAMDAQRLVMRHSVVVGSTGSGKTSFVATLVQNFIRGGWSSANIVIIDLHGEYKSALKEDALISSVDSGETSELHVPYWALPARDILLALSGENDVQQTVLSKFTELVVSARREYAAKAKWLEDSEDITADTPIPFDIYKVWYQFDYANEETTEDSAREKPCIEDKGDAANLTPAKFTPHSPGNSAPYKGSEFGFFSNIPSKMRLRMMDPRFSFFLGKDYEILDRDPLIEIINSWLGKDKPVSVLDFAGAPSETVDLAIGVVLKLLFEISIRSTDSSGLGRHRPVLVVLEEAHRYLGVKQEARIAQEAVNRIAREGRKYGIGVMLVSQRPSELPDTAFSQAGTVVSLRLTNSADQSKVRAGLPDSLAGLAEALPALRTGEALAVGEAIHLPSRMLVKRPNPEPRANDPKLYQWRDKPSENNIETPLENWRGLPQPRKESK